MIITIGLTITQIGGYQVLELIILMIIIDFITLGAIVELQRKEKGSNELIPKLDGIENVCKDILTHITSPNPGFEEKLQKQKEDISYILDKVAKRSMELEERINVFGRALANSIDILKLNLNHKEESKTDEVDSSIGETVFIDEEEEKE
jgi:hypothetical protein